MLMFSHAALGTYIAFANFNRFAVTDGLNSHLKATAMAWVVAGGVIAAFVGPTAASHLRVIDGYADFALCYALFALLAVFATLLNHVTPTAERRDPNPPLRNPSPKRFQIRMGLLLPMLFAASGYGLMNLLMIQASLQMSLEKINFHSISTSIQWHVFAMFAPSFITGYLVTRLGVKTVVFMGIVLIFLTSVLNLHSKGFAAMTSALILLGLGWNFTYVGAGAMLTQQLGDNSEAMRLQGINELLIAIAATAGAFLPAYLLTSAGWINTNIGVAIVCLSLMILLWRHAHTESRSSGRPTRC